MRLARDGHRAPGMKGLGKVAEGGNRRRQRVCLLSSEGHVEAGEQAFQEQAAVDAGFQTG